MRCCGLHSRVLKTRVSPFLLRTMSSQLTSASRMTRSKLSGCRLRPQTLPDREVPTSFRRSHQSFASALRTPLPSPPCFHPPHAQWSSPGLKRIHRPALHVPKAVQCRVAASHCSRLMLMVVLWGKRGVLAQTPPRDRGCLIEPFHIKSCHIEPCHIRLCHIEHDQIGSYHNS